MYLGTVSLKNDGPCVTMFEHGTEKYE